MKLVAGNWRGLRPEFRVPTRLATAAHFVPSSSTAAKRRSSSSALQEPFETRVAIWAHHRLRQSLLVRLGMCLAMACHLDGGLASPSSVGRDGLVFVLALVGRDGDGEVGGR